MYGLIGYPLGHSFSADFFNKKFLAEGIDESYSLFPLKEISEVTGLISSNPSLEGFNVTIPYKQQIIPYLTSLSDEAAEIGAVNVVKISRQDGKVILKGYNSDAIGFRNSLTPLLRPYMDKALVLGTGGASNAVEYVLRKLGMEVTKVSRHPSPGEISYSSLSEEIISENTVIVNTTPLGMWPHVDACPDIPYNFITPRHLCYDLVYNPDVTEFMRRAASQGATTKNGLDMLHGQALAAWDIWTLKD